MALISPVMLELFRRRGVYHRFGGGERWRSGETLRLSPGCELEPYSHILAGHALPHRLGAFTYALSELPSNVSVGRYGSIAAAVEFIQSEHPTDWVTSSPFSYSPHGLQGMRDYLLAKGLTSFVLHSAEPFVAKPVVLGHDVWVGQGAIFKGGVTVGDSAIIAARAVVTADVPPFAIVGGGPARIIRLRFTDALCERLHALAWWRYGLDVLHPLDVRDPERFADRLEALQAGSPPAIFEPAPLTYAEIIAAGTAA